MNFFLVGAPKAGTTSLYRYLDQHPQIYMSPIKEPHYFADEIRLENFSEEMQRRRRPKNDALRRYLDGPMTDKFSGGPVENWSDYVRLFRGMNHETAAGEASPCYLWSPSAAKNIARQFPEAKILMVLRDPAERAFSQYLHMLSFSGKHISFYDYVSAGLSETGLRISETRPFLEFGLYHEQVTRYLKLFSRDRLHIAFYDDYRRDALTFVCNIFGFLGVDTGFQPDLSERHMLAAVPRSHAATGLLKRTGLWKAISAITPPTLRRQIRSVVFRPRETMRLLPADRARLVAYYRDDILRLSRLLGRDLTSWLDF